MTAKQKAIGRRKPKAHTGSAEPGVQPGRPKRAKPKPAQRDWREQAQLMWSHNYASLMLEEVLDVPDLTAAAASLMDNALSTSKWAAKRLAEAGGAEGFASNYAKKIADRMRDVAAVARRSRSTHDVPFSVAARSVAYLARNVPYKVWNQDCARRLVVAKATAQLLAEHMAEVEPQPEWLQSPHVVAAGFDQNYLLKACKGKGGKRVAGSMRGMERADAEVEVDHAAERQNRADAGMPVRYLHADVVNSTHYPLPAGLVPLTDEEVRARPLVVQSPPIAQ